MILSETKFPQQLNHPIEITCVTFKRFLPRKVPSSFAYRWVEIAKSTDVFFLVELHNKLYDWVKLI